MSNIVFGAIFLGLGVVVLQLGMALWIAMIWADLADAGLVVGFLTCGLGFSLIGAGGEMVLSPEPIYA